MRIQLGKSDGIYGFQFGNQPLTTTIHSTFELRSRIQILLIECYLVSYRWIRKSCDTISFVKLYYDPMEKGLRFLPLRVPNLGLQDCQSGVPTTEPTQQTYYEPVKLHTDSCSHYTLAKLDLTVTEKKWEVLTLFIIPLVKTRPQPDH